MYKARRFLASLAALMVSSPWTIPDLSAQGALTVQIGGTPTPPTSLVAHGESWHYHKGTNAPQASWQTLFDASLDGTWATGPGGFGFGDGDDTTELTDMIGRYPTLYIRRSFESPATIDSSRRLELEMDWDDAFIAWLDGIEIARSSNAPGAVGEEPPFGASSLAPNHEASGGQNGNPPTVYDLGPADVMLPPGPHILAIMGLNAGSASSDFSLIADLSLTGGMGTVTEGQFFSLVTTNSIQLSGSNTLAGAASVVVNGDEAAFNPGDGTWSKTQALKPGLNRLYIASLDAAGNILGATNRDVVAELETFEIGGAITSTLALDTPGAVVRLTDSVTVSAGGNLVLEGAVVLLGPGQSIRADNGGQVNASASAFLPADGSTAWGQLSANGAAAAMSLGNCEVVAGQLRVTSGGELLLNGCTVREMYARQMLEGVNGNRLTIQDSHFLNYAQTHIDFTPTLVADSLFENITSDAMDFAGAPAEIVVYRTTWRQGFGGNTDAIDLGDNEGVVIDQCLIHHFPDKGISIADHANSNTVRNTLIHHCGSGLNVYASSNNVFLNTTVYGCSNSVRLYERTAGQGAGFAVASNLIVWGNINSIVLADGAALDLTYSDVQDGGFPGEGNISADPLFGNPAAGDFTLAAGSPALGTGLGGVDMGARVTALPPGGLPPTPTYLAALPGLGSITLTWNEDADNEAGFLIHRSTDGTTWEGLASAPANATSLTLPNLTPGTPYYFRVMATNGAGVSRWSNLARTAARDSTIYVGGVLSANATWSPDQGMFCVHSNLIVPSGITLTILAGTEVCVTNNASIRAVNGGTLRVLGEAGNVVQVRRVTPVTSHSEVSAQFGASMLLQYADIVGMQVSVYSNATALVEDSFIHDYRLLSGGTILTAPLMLTHFAAPTTVRRTHFREYHETLWRNGVLHIEDCLFENIHGDGVDFDAAQPGTYLRRSTFRHGVSGNVDAVDVGPADLPGSTAVVIEDCLMYDFPFDKGVSVGDFGESHGTIVRNCLIYGCRAGVMAKDSCDVQVINCTIADNAWGLTNYNKANPGSPTGGGITTNTHNNVIWGNTIAISMVNASVLTADHNNLGGTNWPGTGNINVDPRFLNAGEKDYRLAPDSPCLGAGRNGADMGARFPVGALMALSHPRIESFRLDQGGSQVRFWADSERSYSVLCSDAITGAPWTKVADFDTATLPRFVAVTNNVAPGSRFYQLVSPKLP